MANPNLLSLTTASPGIVGVALANTSENSILNNASSSGTAIKVNTLFAANSDSVSRTVTINYHSAASLGGTSYPIVSAVSIPANSTNAVIIKDTQIYLTENTSLGATAGTSNTITITASYETLS